MRKSIETLTGPLVDALRLDRRRFCQGMAAASAALGACQLPVETVEKEDMDFLEQRRRDMAHIDLRPSDRDMTPGADLAPGPDLSTSGDMAVMCPIDIVDTKRLPGSFALNTATYFASDKVFICRDSGGLFAMTAVCTHIGCAVNPTTGSEFLCPCHASRYDWNGAVLVGPASSPLVHFAICLTGFGTVAYAPRSIVRPEARF